MSDLSNPGSSVCAAFTDRAPRDLAGWAALFKHADLPVLPDTAATLEDMRPMEDAVDAHMLADSIGGDPLMTLKLLAHVAELRRGREGSEVETATEALVMLGIPPFFRAFGPQAVAQDRLADWPEALAGFQKVLRRSHRAARFAIGFAVHRMDHDAPVIHEAALLHDFTELLLWLQAPALALEIERRQALDSSLRSVVVQREVLHVTLADLQQHLMESWSLPSLLVRITDDKAPAAGQQVRNVLLAIRIARHSAQDWDNAALPDDVQEAATLLQLSTDSALRLMREIDSDE